MDLPNRIFSSSFTSNLYQSLKINSDLMNILLRQALVEQLLLLLVRGVVFILFYIPILHSMISNTT